MEQEASRERAEKGLHCEENANRITNYVAKENYDTTTVGILSNYLIGFWLKRNASFSVVSAFGKDAMASCRGICLALCCRGCWSGAERALSVPAMWLAAPSDLRAQQRWCGSLSFMLQLSPAAACSQMVTREPFEMFSITRSISLILSLGCENTNVAWRHQCVMGAIGMEPDNLTCSSWACKILAR